VIGMHMSTGGTLCPAVCTCFVVSPCKHGMAHQAHIACKHGMIEGVCQEDYMPL
jgi:hypothetical protein